MTSFRLSALVALFYLLNGCSWLGGSAYQSSKVKTELLTLEQFEVDFGDQILGLEGEVPEPAREIVQEYVSCHRVKAKTPLRFWFYHSCLTFQFPATAPTEPDVVIAEGRSYSVLWTGGNDPHIVPDKEARYTPDAEISVRSTMRGASWPSAEYRCLLLVSCESAFPSDCLLFAGRLVVRMNYRGGKWRVGEPEITAFPGFE